ncbi:MULTISPECIES: hypothetical protein [unclassified Empedobacter]|uniref:hypothetical protein n=1 Tax=unclassified Empedobacter TaxID=2643773 RepID=UPI0025C50198|nr:MULTISPECIES: hypothetical protein [unclassified Empedobacter]
MKIIKKRINNPKNYLSTIRNEESFHIAFTDINSKIERVNQIGFTNTLNIGERILPYKIGSVSRFNADGKFLKLKELPKETYYVEREWTWKDFTGHEYSKIVSIQRQRYQRQLIPPPCEEFTINDFNKNKIIVSRVLTNNPENYEDIKHIMNLFLEYFGEFDLIREDLQPFVFENITRLNWKIFPRGEYPFERIREVANERIQRQPSGNRPVIENHLEIISAYNANFVAVGQGGFYDYIVFGFPERNIYILESIKTGNATYVFDRNWEELSQYSKAEILNNHLQLERFVHSPSWEQNINSIFQ